jgi:mRNA interferase MazF
MRSGIMPEQGDILLLPVPFTDLSSSKRRPVIVVSKNEYHQTTSDMVVVAMTSNPTRTPYSFIITSSDLTAGSLNRPGYVRADKIYTLAQNIAVKTFGRVNNATLERIRVLLQELTEI